MIRRFLVVLVTALIVSVLTFDGAGAQGSGDDTALPTPVAEDLLEASKAPASADRSPSDGSSPWVVADGDLVLPADLVVERPTTEWSDFVQPFTGAGFEAVDGFAGNRGMYWIRLATSQVVSNAQVESLRTYAEISAQRLAQATGGTYRVASGIVDLSDTGVDPATAEPVQGEILIVVSNTSPCAAGWIGCGGPQSSITDPNNENDRYLTSGKVWIHPSVLTRSFDDQLHVMQHELGHAVGLMHFDDPFETQLQMMHSSSLEAPAYRNGDVNGLTYLHPAGPQNNAFASATTLAAAGETVTQITFGADTETGEPNHDGTTSGSSVWFSWTAPKSGEAQFTTFFSNYDTALAVYTGSTVGGLTLVGSNDDYDSTSLFSLVDVAVTAGTTYHIAVDGVFGDAGVLVMSVLEPKEGQMTPVAPVRVLETRPSNGSTITQTGYTGAKPGAGQEIVVQVTGNGGVPAGATAAVLNVTVTQPDANGFLVVYACGQTRPTAANLNWTAGQTIPNLVIAPLDAQGRTCIYVLSSTHVIADVSGYYAREGEQLNTTPPSRLLETRATNVGLGITQTGYTGAKPGAGQEIVVQVTGNGGVPAGATAAVLNVTVT
ncbi:MAG: hypothetical protein KDB21_11915, partial [Acidimicrobiales bacterium]|nr:hypothetical protein [Acidimicrobiales bacterium]